jgi:hypothetical protein
MHKRRARRQPTGRRRWLHAAQSADQIGRNRSQPDVDLLTAQRTHRLAVGYIPASKDPRRGAAARFEIAWLVQIGSSIDGEREHYR